MPHYAHIIDGIVREVIAVDDIAGRYHPDLIWMACPPECAEGWRLISGQLVAPDDYRALRVLAPDGYAPLAEQLDMQYRDMLDGGTRWPDHIAAVKAAYPKPEAG